MDATSFRKPFRYRDLDYQSKQIRVLELEEELSPDGHVQCTLSNVTLTGTHMALSYEWGPETIPYTVLVNGSPMIIRRNLWLFLRIARTKYPKIPLWVDAICINQSAILERNHQVQLMAEVYANSKQVIVWLGSGDSDVLEIFQRISTKGQDSSNMGRELAMIPPQQLWDMSHIMSSLTYWTRAWIVQEFLLAPQKTILYGAAECQESDLQQFFSQNSVFHLAVGEGRDKKIYQSQAEVLCANAGGRRGTPKKLTFSKCLQRYGDARWSDFHDAIYALRSLFIGGQMFPVDYSLTELELFTTSLLFYSIQAESRRLSAPKATEWAKYIDLIDPLTRALRIHDYSDAPVDVDPTRRLPLQPQKPVFDPPYLINKIVLDPSIKATADMFEPWRRENFPGDYQPILPPLLRRAVRTGDAVYSLTWASLLFFVRPEGTKGKIFATVTVRERENLSWYQFHGNLYSPYLEGAFIEPVPTTHMGGSSRQGDHSRLMLESTYEGVMLFALEDDHYMRESVLALLAQNNNGRNHPNRVRRFRYSYRRVDTGWVLAS